jgi:hypothetical protein
MQTVRRARLMGISLAGLGLLGLTALMFLILNMFSQAGPAWVVLVAGFTAALVLIVARLGGRTAPERIGALFSARRRTRNGDAANIAGPLSAQGVCRPQGLLGEMVSVACTTVTGQPFTLLWFASTKTGAVVFDVESSDKAGISQESIDALVGNWAGMLVSAATLYEPGLITIVTDSSIGDGAQVKAAATEQRQRLRAVSMVGSPLDPDDGMLTRRREKLARISQETEALTARIASNTPVIRQRVTVSFVPSRARTEDGKAEETLEAVAAAAAAAVPDVMHWLRLTGCRTVAAATMADIAEATRCAFDPPMMGVFEQARAEADPIRLAWEDAGPASSYAGKKYFEHEDSVSATMQMTGPPAGAFTETAMGSLYAPDPAAQLRRVTQYFTPFTMEESDAIASKYVDISDNESQGGKRVKARQTKEMVIARETEKEITNKGAVMYRYAMAITITSRNAQELKAAKQNLLGSAKGGIKVGLRNTYRQTDTAFTLGLGLGLVPSRVASIKDIVRESL